MGASVGRGVRHFACACQAFENTRCMGSFTATGRVAHLAYRADKIHGRQKVRGKLWGENHGNIMVSERKVWETSTFQGNDGNLSHL